MKNSINLVSVVDTFINSCSSNGYDYTVSSTGLKDLGGYMYAYPTSSWKTFDSFFDTISFPKVENSVYPVHNLFVDEHGTFILQIATTGFKRDELDIERKGTKLIIKGKLPKSDEPSRKKEIWKKITIKDFEAVYQCPEEIDLDSIDITLKNGLLEIKMPLKAKEQPIKLDIN